MATSLLTSAAEHIYGRVSGKQDANKWYKVLVPELREALERGTPITDPQVKRLISPISELPSSGAKQRNFVRRYMQDRDSMLKLPRDPNTMMYGYWW
ncbi:MULTISPECIES: hypothetical protein [Vibrio]|uniref:hypothetical protein n=1 Tax=Vibrio TaxID=662 RepID=UPI002075BECE|nr:MULTISPECIES: hypothetical protein [Vibrio]USD33962.1 hypothetical protein J8Z27_07720 [Vibrio sp. SCSIO 43186]USD44232.1 hypothetical protein J4N38_08105 [Vibrio sp. SCSIO 43145]USD71085.1 hypothetical protein J4N41_07720 [Vibrio sp. SCSIO 43139]USD95991.1 hypothetical protein CTT30_07825 [Vibrio coralliilyticus]